MGTTRSRRDSSSPYLRAWRRLAAEHCKANQKKHKEIDFVYRLERANLKKDLRRSGATESQTERALRVLELQQSPKHREIEIERRDAVGAESAEFWKDLREQARLAPWTPQWFRAAAAQGDRRSLAWWDRTIRSAAEDEFLEWLRLSHRLVWDRLAPSARLPVGIPDFAELEELPVVRERIDKIRRYGNEASLDRLRMALVPARPGRPSTPVNATALAAARAFRDQFKRELQRRARRARQSTSRALDQQAVLDSLYPECAPEARADVLATIAKKGPGEAAAVVAAKKFGLPLRLVRSERVTLPAAPRVRQAARVVYRDDLEAVERAETRRQLGRAKKSAEPE